MKAHLLTIGDELLIGQTVNTNAAWLGEQLSLLGIDVVGGATVGDEATAIRRALDWGFAQASLVVTTGGLGPTHDDLTKQVVADYFGKELREDESLRRRIESYYERRERSVPAAVRAIAEIPEGFEMLENPVGTAPGLFYADEKDGRLLVVLPGVPSEMKSIAEAAVLPRLRERASGPTLVHRTLLTAGIAESSLQEKLGNVSELLHDRLKLAYLPSTSGVRLRMTARGESREEAEARLDQLEAYLRERAGKYIFGTDDDTLEGVVGRMLRERGLTVAAAESATGGHVADRLTDVSGASAYLRGGVVAYSNDAKVDVLGVDPEALREHGAVSEAVARQMARGARKHLGADLAISTTGIAGPTGGTPEKPVGTLWIGVADAEGEEAFRLQFTDDRQLNKELFSTAALEAIRRRLLRPEQQPA